jgi:hypothetical protein
MEEGYWVLTTPVVFAEQNLQKQDRACGLK